MTIRELVTQYCSDRGMFAKDAAAVAELAKNSPLNAMLQERWESDVKALPSASVIALTLAVDVVALDYIDRHYPDAWFRSMFKSGAEK
jgi:hypothetical protein